MALLPSGQACLRPRCYGGCLLVSHQVPGCRRPQPRAGQNSGRFHCPFCQTYPEPAPHPGSQHLLGPGAFSPHPLPLICPQHPRCPGTPPAELSLPHSPLPAPLPRGPHTSLTGRRSPSHPFPVATGRHLQTSIWHILQRPCPALRGPSRAPPILTPGFPSETSVLLFQRSVRHKRILKCLVVLP